MLVTLTQVRNHYATSYFGSLRHGIMSSDPKTPNQPVSSLQIPVSSLQECFFFGTNGVMGAARAKIIF